MNYLKNISKFDIVNKEGQRVAFIPNTQQTEFINSLGNKDVILKARQIGFSSIILAIYTLDFLTIENSRSVCISHDSPSGQKLLDRVKFFIKSAEDKGLEVKLRINNRNELVNDTKNSTFYIGAAGSKTFGRGDTITNLHLSEFAFYPDAESLLSSVLQAVVPTGRTFIESTANGMNFYKAFWDKAKAGLNGFKPHFFDNSFYSPEFLAQKLQELGDEMFAQEYPATDTQAFVSSGNPFFDKESLTWYLNHTQEPIATYGGYYDLSL